MANDDIDPTIFQNMLRVLNDQDALAKSTFSKRSEQGVENMKNMLERLNKLKKYLRESLAGLNDNEDKELGALTDDITKQRINKLISSNLSPEEIVKNIKQMIDEKHELELNQLIAKKQEILAERQTYLLQESLGVKAVEIQQARKDFFNKRSQVETSALHPSAKFAELQSLEKKESEKMTEINYNFINNLSNQQDSM